MAYKDLLVVLDAAPRSRERLHIAARLAEAFESHLAVLFLAPLGGTGAEAAAREHFEQVRTAFSISAEWRSATGDPAQASARHGRYADLIVLGQIESEALTYGVIQPRPEEVALLAGRPILVIPYTGQFAQIGRHLLVGWDASREAARAVNDAMPLLQRAQSVTVLTVDARQSRNGHGDIPGADIGLHLARHGINTRVEATVSAGIGVGNTLLSRASDLGIDLLVMGAYGHSRVRELLLGGATRTVLESMTLPVLMAH